MRVNNPHTFAHKCCKKHFELSSVTKNGKKYTIIAKKYTHEGFSLKFRDLFHPIQWFKRNFYGESTITFKGRQKQIDQISVDLKNNDPKKESGLYSKDELLITKFNEMLNQADN